MGEKPWEQTAVVLHTMLQPLMLCKPFGLFSPNFYPVPSTPSDVVLSESARSAVGDE